MKHTQRLGQLASLARVFPPLGGKRTPGSSSTHLSLSPFLLMLPLLAVGNCKGEGVVVNTDCLKVLFSGAKKSGGGISVRGASIEAGSTPCPKLTAATIVIYNDKNGLAGYQSGEDDYVTSLEGDLEVPSGKIQIGSFSNQADGKTGSSWEITITSETGGESYFQGSF